MDVYGLTGGIGSGKSTVASLLEEYGVPVVSADELSRIVVSKGSDGLADVVERFGPGVVDEAGELDRRKMATIVFQDPAQRRELEAILHPRIRERFEQVLDALEKAGHEVAVYEVPLLFEKNLQGDMKAVILVTSPESVRVRRVRTRDDVTETEVRARIAAQMDEALKRKKADYVLENDGSLDDLRREVEFLLARFLRLDTRRRRQTGETPAVDEAGMRRTEVPIGPPGDAPAASPPPPPGARATPPPSSSPASERRTEVPTSAPPPPSSAPPRVPPAYADTRPATADEERPPMPPGYDSGARVTPTGTVAPGHGPQAAQTGRTIAPGQPPAPPQGPLPGVPNAPMPATGSNPLAGVAPVPMPGRRGNATPGAPVAPMPNPGSNPPGAPSHAMSGSDSTPPPRGQTMIAPAVSARAPRKTVVASSTGAPTSVPNPGSNPPRPPVPVPKVPMPGAGRGPRRTEIASAPPRPTPVLKGGTQPPVQPPDLLAPSSVPPSAPPPLTTTKKDAAKPAKPNTQRAPAAPGGGPRTGGTMRAPAVGTPAFERQLQVELERSDDPEDEVKTEIAKAVIPKPPRKG